MLYLSIPNGYDALPMVKSAAKTASCCTSVAQGYTYSILQCGGYLGVMRNEISARSFIRVFSLGDSVIIIIIRIIFDLAHECTESGW
jgi:hypothetical protein